MEYPHTQNDKRVNKKLTRKSATMKEGMLESEEGKSLVSHRKVMKSIAPPKNYKRSLVSEMNESNYSS